MAADRKALEFAYKSRYCVATRKQIALPSSNFTRHPSVVDYLYRVESYSSGHGIGIILS